MMNHKTYFRPSFKQAVILTGSLILTSIVNAGNAENGNLTAQGNIPASRDISCWITKPDKSALLQKQSALLHFSTPAQNVQAIVVDETSRFQAMDGFGAALTGGSAQLINNLPVADREKLLKELFLLKDNGIGISYLRISIGASDLDASVFSYNDLPEGETDVDLKQFSINPDRKDLIPVLKSILKLNPGIKIMASPWSAPVWMKNNRKSVGGSLLPEYYGVYAKYLVRYINDMKTEGIPIDAITIQNEPLYGGNNPSMVMQAEEQRDFISKHLGPAFKNAGIKTKIVLYDHNCDRPDYPTSILADNDAAQYVDGSAFHLYGGEITALTTVHDAYPAKNVYFTEQWVGGPSKFAEDMRWYVENIIIGAPRNWSKNVIEWNLASDPTYNPHTPGSCTQCEGLITIGSNAAVTRNVAYYTIAHASRFVPMGSVRIASNTLSNLPNVAYKTPDGKIVLIVLNTSKQSQVFEIGFGGKSAQATLPAGAVATYTW